MTLTRLLPAFFSSLIFYACDWSKATTGLTIEGDETLISNLVEYLDNFDEVDRIGYLQTINGNSSPNIHAQCEVIDRIYYNNSWNENFTIKRGADSVNFNLYPSINHYCGTVAHFSTYFDTIPWSASLYVPELFNIYGPLEENSEIISKSAGTYLEWDVDTSAENNKGVFIEIKYDHLYNNAFRTSAPDKHINKYYLIQDVGIFQLSPQILRAFPDSSHIVIDINKGNYLNTKILGKNFPVDVRVINGTSFYLIK